jgi:hypothetical protein
MTITFLQYGHFQFSGFSRKVYTPVGTCVPISTLFILNLLICIQINKGREEGGDMKALDGDYKKINLSALAGK